MSGRSRRPGSGTSGAYSAESLTIEPVPDEDLKAFHEIRNNHGSGHETWEDTLYHHEKWPRLSVAAYLDDPTAIETKGKWRTFPPENLIGVAVGKPWEQDWGMISNPPTGDHAVHIAESIVLENISIDHRYWRRGFGSRLLAGFEEQTARMGRKRVALGAAENIDAFYLANGYKIVGCSASVERPKLPENYEDLGYDITRFCDLNWRVSIQMPANRFEPEKREEIKKAFNAEQVNYSYEKEV